MNKPQLMVEPRRLLIVGSVRGPLLDGRIGGQAFACRSLLDSDLAKNFKITTVDSSISSITAGSGLRRAPVALRRLWRFSMQMLTDRPHATLLFASHGLSFIEKGVMAQIARAFGVRAVLLPRSGHLAAQISNGRLFKRFVTRVISQADIVICQSTSWQRFFEQISGNRENLRVVENWLPDHAFAPSDAPPSCSGGRDFVVGFYNRIEEEKGIFDFIEAVRKARDHIPVLRGLIYGDGSCVNEVKRTIRELEAENFIEFRGWLSETDKIAALRQLDAYIFCSHFEGFPNSLLEVLALKIPVIAVRVGAVPDVLSDGVSAYLADIKDTERISEAICALATDRALGAAFAQAAYVRVSNCNTLAGAVSRINETLLT